MNLISSYNKKRQICHRYHHFHIMWQAILLLTWGCIPEVTRDCQDMTNASSTYIGIAVGAVIGLVISWWIYNRQKKTTESQDIMLRHIKELDEHHDSVLKKLEESEARHDSTLNAILELNKKIEHIIERQDKLQKSIQRALSKDIDRKDQGVIDNSKNQ